MSNIEEHIRKAIEEGQFDNLPGKGKPLKLDENPHENPEWRLAYTMLKGSGFSLPWIEARREIESSIEKANTTLLHAWEYRQRELSHGALYAQAHNEWLRAASAYRQRIAEINKNILDYNLAAPSPQFHLLAMEAEKEINRLTEAR